MLRHGNIADDFGIGGDTVWEYRGNTILAPERDCTADHLPSGHFTDALGKSIAEHEFARSLPSSVHHHSASCDLQSNLE